jgi:hypothetical protein
MNRLTAIQWINILALIVAGGLAAHLFRDNANLRYESHNRDVQIEFEHARNAQLIMEFQHIKNENVLLKEKLRVPETATRAELAALLKEKRDHIAKLEEVLVTRDQDWKSVLTQGSEQAFAKGQMAVWKKLTFHLLPVSEKKGSFFPRDEHFVEVILMVGEYAFFKHRIPTRGKEKETIKSFSSLANLAALSRYLGDLSDAPAASADRKPQAQ